jgi:hypothetical protein
MREEQKEFQQSFESIRQILFHSKNRNYENQIDLAETVRFLSSLQGGGILSEQEGRWVNSWIKKCQHVLHLEFEFNLVMTMRYYKKNRHDNPYGAHLPPLAAILTLEALEVSGSKIGRGDTRWKKAGDFVQVLANDMDSLLHSASHESDEGAAWFIIFNAIDFLHSLDGGSAFQSAYETFINVVEDHQDKLRTEMVDSPGLRVYAHDLSTRGVISAKVDEPTRSLPDRAQIYASLNQLSRGEEVSPSNLPNDLPEDKQHLWGIARSWARAVEAEPTGILPCHGKLDLDEVFRRVWGDQENIQRTSISDEDLETVRDMTDGDIQDSLVGLFQSNDYVTTISKGTLDLERNKAHTGIEISDFDIRIEWGEDNTLPVSLPIKSAREAKGRTAEQLAEDNLHQLVRPLSRFNSPFGAVFPILIAGHSVNANEAMNIVRSNLDLPIAPIGERTFTRILKYNNLI